MRAGDQCLIGSGDYRETVVPAASGTAAAPITYQRQPGASVTVDGTDPVPAAAWAKVSSAPLLVNGVPDPFLSQSLSPFASTLSAGDIYSAHVVINTNSSLPNSAGPDPQVFYMGAWNSPGPAPAKMMLQAQWPPSTPTQDPLNPTVEMMQDGSNNATIVDSKLTQPPGYWVGAKVYVNTVYNPETVTVTSSQPGSLTVCCFNTVVSQGSGGGTPPVSTPVTNASSNWNVGCGVTMGGIAGPTTRFYLYDKLENLSKPGDWFYDQSSQTLYFRSPTGAKPVDGAVTVKQRNLAFDLTNNVSYTHLTGLNVFGAAVQTGYDVASGHNGADAGQYSTGDVVDSLNIDYPAHFIDLPKDGDPNVAGYSCAVQSDGMLTAGVVLAGHGNTIQNSTIAHSAGGGVLLQSNYFQPLYTYVNPALDPYVNCPTVRGCGRTDPPLPGNTATNNIIHDVDYSSAYIPSGIDLSGDNNTVTYNTISKTGRDGLQINNLSSGTESFNNRIAYNDVSGWGMLNLDVAAMYFIAQINFSPTDGAGGTTGTLHPGGTRVDHNWVHDPLAMPGMLDPSEEGIYPDGGDVNLQIDNNVGWGSLHGTVTIMGAGGGLGESPSWGMLVFNNETADHQLAADMPNNNTQAATAPQQLTFNDIGGWANIGGSGACNASGADCSQFVNNIGDTLWPFGDPDPRLVFSNNLPSACAVGQPSPGTSKATLVPGCDPGYVHTGAGCITTGPTATCDPGYVDTRVRNFQLQPTSAARMAGQKIPGVTDGSTDATPSIGAYQYGAPRWVPGAQAQPSSVESHYGPTTIASIDPGTWNNPYDALGLPNAYKLTYLSTLGPPVSGNIKYGYSTASANPSEPAFANNSNLAIDSVELQFYGMGYTHVASRQVTLTAGSVSSTGQTTWSSSLWSTQDPFVNFDRPVSIDISQQVAGNWSNLPTWVNIYGSLTPAEAQGWILTGSTGIFVDGLEVVVHSHCINTTIAPCA